MSLFRKETGRKNASFRTGNVNQSSVHYFFTLEKYPTALGRGPLLSVLLFGGMRHRQGSGRMKLGGRSSLPSPVQGLQLT